MQIIEPSAKIVRPNSPYPFDRDHGINLLRVVEGIGRVSHRSEDKQTDNSWERFIKAIVLSRGDWSITEHVNVTVIAIVDRGITHEWVRHRIGAYTQESTRFVNYAIKLLPSFVLPPFKNSDSQLVWELAVGYAEAAYKKLVDEMGESPQLARGVFPTNLAAKLVVTYNLRSWRHFFLMRTTKESHPQMRQVTIPLLAEFKSVIPLLYDDIEPEAKQSDNLKKAR